MNIIGLSVIELAKKIRTGELSAVELTQHYINQIQQYNPMINAVVQFDPERALMQAKKCDQLQAKGQLLGPLHGVPFTLKEVYHTKGDAVTLGCLALTNNVVTDDGEIVKRLYRAGGVLLGKTNTPEFEAAIETDNLVYGKTNNVYALNYSAGGSSGGSAAAVAACFAAFDIGADQGGSLRVPAYYNGVACLRPTPGLVPTTGIGFGARHGFGSLFTSEGPMARFATDLPLLLSIIAGPDQVDPKAIPVELGKECSGQIESLRIAYLTDDGFVEPIAAVKDALTTAAAVFRDAGCVTANAMPEVMHQGYQVFLDLLGANTNSDLTALFAELQVEPAPLTQKLLQRMQPYRCELAEFMQRWLRWDEYRANLLAFFQDYDILMLPVTADLPLADSVSMWDKDQINKMSYCWSISAGLLPATVVRVGTANNGLPLAVQLVAKPWHDMLAIKAAIILEEALGGYQPPTFNY